MVKSKAIRIRLDLSSISNVEHKLQWAYISIRKVLTINDLIKHISLKHLNSSNASSKLDYRKIELYLEDPFLLPPSEDIRLLQNGDLITVKLKNNNAVTAKINNKSFTPKETDFQKKPEKCPPSSSTSETDENRQTHKTNLANNQKAVKEKLNSSRVGTTEPKNPSFSNSSSSSSDSTSNSSETDSKAITNTRNELCKNLSFNSKISSSETKIVVSPKNFTISTSNDRNSTSSSSSSSSSTDSEKLSKNAAKTTTLANEDMSFARITPFSSTKPAITPIPNLPNISENGSSNSSGSDEPATQMNLKPPPNEESKSTETGEGKRKRKRKRKRKSKNKNKLETDGINQECDEPAIDNKNVSFNDKENKGVNYSTYYRQVIPSSFNGENCNSKSHIYFDNEEKNEDAMECDESSISYSPKNPSKMNIDTCLEKTNNKTQESSFSEAFNSNTTKKIQSKKKSLEAPLPPFLYNGADKETLPYKKKKLEPSSKVISCEEALLGRLNLSNKAINGTSLHQKSVKPVSEKLRAALPPTPSQTSINAISNGNDFTQLLSFAKSSPIRASRSSVAFNPVTRSNDVWSNKSTLIRAGESMNKTESSKTQQNVSEMASFLGLPSVGDRIAFKLFEMSENYTPCMSEYKFGEVKESCSQKNKVRIKIDSNCISKPKEGKFEMPEYDSSEQTADTQGSEMMFHWNEIYEPKKLPA